MCGTETSLCCTTAAGASMLYDAELMSIEDGPTVSASMKHQALHAM